MNNSNIIETPVDLSNEDKFIYYTINNGVHNDVYISFDLIPYSSKLFWKQMWEKKPPHERLKISHEEFPLMKRATETLKNKK